MLEFTPLSFIYAIVNFLILVWLLHKLLHKPLLDVLEKRRASIQRTREKARTEAEEAAELKDKYAAKLAEFEEQRDELLAEAKRAAESARDQLLDKARQDAEQQAADRERDWEREEQDAAEAFRGRIVATSFELARKILGQMADDDIDAKLRSQLCGELAKLAEHPPRERKALFAGDAPVKVTGAGRWSKAERDEITERVQALSATPVRIEFAQDSKLIAGCRVEFVSTAIDATLADTVGSVLERFAAAEAGSGKS